MEITITKHFISGIFKGMTYCEKMKFVNWEYAIN